MKNRKIPSWIKLVFVVIALGLIPFVIEWIFLSNGSALKESFLFNYGQHFSRETWFLFLSSYLGAGVTTIALILTLWHSTKQNKIDNDLQLKRFSAEIEIKDLENAMKKQASMVDEARSILLLEVFMNKVMKIEGMLLRERYLQDCIQSIINMDYYINASINDLDEIEDVVKYKDKIQEITKQYITIIVDWSNSLVKNNAKRSEYQEAKKEYENEKGIKTNSLTGVRILGIKDPYEEFELKEPPTKKEILDNFIKAMIVCKDQQAPTVMQVCDDFSKHLDIVLKNKKSEVLSRIVAS